MIWHVPIRISGLVTVCLIGFTFVQPSNGCPQATQNSLALDVADIIQALSLTRCVDYAGYDDQGAQELMRMYQTIHTDHKVRVTDLTMCRTVLDGLILPCYVEA